MLARLPVTHLVVGTSVGTLVGLHANVMVMSVLDQKDGRINLSISHASSTSSHTPGCRDFSRGLSWPAKFIVMSVLKKAKVNKFQHHRSARLFFEDGVGTGRS